MAGHDRLKGDHTLVIRLLNATEESRIVVAQVISVTVATSDETGIHACRVAVPDIPTRFVTLARVGEAAEVERISSIKTHQYKSVRGSQVSTSKNCASRTIDTPSSSSWRFSRMSSPLTQ